MSTTIMQPSTFFAAELPDPSELPDHTQLPDKDGNFVRNFLEPPQSYWKLTDPPLEGCKSPIDPDNLQS